MQVGMVVGKMTQREARATAAHDVCVGHHEDGNWLVDTYGFLKFDVRPHFTTYFTHREALAERRRMIEELTQLQIASAEE